MSGHSWTDKASLRIAYFAALPSANATASIRIRGTSVTGMMSGKISSTCGAVVDYRLDVGISTFASLACVLLVICKSMPSTPWTTRLSSIISLEAGWIESATCQSGSRDYPPNPREGIFHLICGSAYCCPVYPRNTKECSSSGPS